MKIRILLTLFWLLSILTAKSQSNPCQEYKSDESFIRAYADHISPDWAIAPDVAKDEALKSILVSVSMEYGEEAFQAVKFKILQNSVIVCKKNVSENNKCHSFIALEFDRKYLSDYKKKNSASNSTNTQINQNNYSVQKKAYSNSANNESNNKYVSFNQNQSFFGYLAKAGPILKESNDLVRGEFETYQEFESRKSNASQNAKIEYQKQLEEFNKNETGVYHYTDIPLWGNLAQSTYNMDKYTFYPALTTVPLGRPESVNKEPYNETDLSRHLISRLDNLKITNKISIEILIKLPPKEAEQFKKTYIEEGYHTIDLTINRSYGIPISHGAVPWSYILLSKVEVTGCVIKNKSGNVIYDLSQGSINTSAYASENRDWSKMVKWCERAEVKVTLKNGEVIQGRIRADKTTKNSFTLMDSNLRNPSYSFKEIYFKDIQSVEYKEMGQRTWKTY